MSQSGPVRVVRPRWRASLALAATLSALSAGAQANVIKVAASAVNAGGSSCSLIDAINAANTNTATGACPAGDDKTNGGDVIVLAAGTYKIGSVDNDWYGPNGLPPITSKITIVGDPQGTVIMRSANQGVQAFRIFFVGGGQPLTPTYNPPTDFSTLPGPGKLTLINLTIENGLAQGGAGGTSTSGNGGGGLGAGGAIYNQGTLTLQGVTLLGNQALGGASGSGTSSNNGDPGGGGGIAGGGDGFGNGGGFNTNGSWPDNTTPPREFGNGGGPNQTGGVGGGGGNGKNGGFGGGGGGSGGAGGFGGGGGSGAFGGFGGGSVVGGGGAGMGGAIFNEGGVLTLLNCTLTDNNAGGGNSPFPALGNGLALGGAIFNLNGSVHISFSTLANNTLGGTTGTTGDGGAIYSLQLASAGSPAADASSSTSLTVSSSILYGTELDTTDSSDNVTSAAATDCMNTNGSFAGSPNIIGATSASCFVAGDDTASPFLFPIANNGGPTQTMAVLPGLSPAVNTGSASGAPLLDQRGYLRDGTPDMGAYEFSNTAKVQPGFGGLQNVTLIAGNNASLAWFNLSGNDSTQPALAVSVLSGNTTVLPAANLKLSANCGGSLALDTCSLNLMPTATKTGTANVTLIATNGYGQTGYGSFTATVIPPVPVAKNDSESVASGQTLNASLSATDALSVTFTYSLVTQTAHGTLKLTSPSSSAYAYKPDDGYIGPDSFTWKANDGTSDSNVATVSITVTLPPPPPGAPTVSDMTLSTAQNTVLNGTLQATGASISFAIAGKPTHGTVKLNDSSTGAFSYTPAAGYNGSDSFTFTAENTLLKATSNPATVNITVGSGGGSGSSSGGSSSGGSSSGGSSSGGSSSGGASSGGSSSGGSSSGGSSSGGSSSGGGTNSVAPLASAMTLSTYSGTPVSGVLTASDAAGNALSFSVTAPAHGAVKLTNATTGAFTYTPTAGYSGPDGFSFTATDTVTGLNSATAIVTLSVNSVPVSSKAVPLASNANFTTYMDTAVSGMLSASDAAGNPLNYVLSTAPTHGTVIITATSGAFNYTPSTSYTGSDRFSFTATDAVTGVASAAATVALTMDALPSPSATTTAPVASDATLTTYEAVPIVNASLSASDALGNGVTYAVGTPAHGVISGFVPATGVYTYTPTGSYIGSDSFTFTATDNSNGKPSNTATVSITVGAKPPPAPVAANLSVSAYEDVPVTVVLAASDGAGDPLTYAIASGPSHAASPPTLNTSTGALSYTPFGGYVGSDSLTFTASASNGVSAPATVSFSVITNPVVLNPLATPAPLASNSTVTVYENSSLSNQQLVGTAGVASDVLAYAITSPPLHGAISGFVPATGVYTYTPTANYSGPDVFTFTVADTTNGQVSAQATVIISVAAPPVTAPPQASNASFTLYSGQALNGTLVAVDAAGHALSYSAVQPTHGTVSVATSGGFTYTPNAGYVGSDSFSFTAIDGISGAASSAAAVSLTVQALPITGVAPLANGGSLALYAGQAATGILAAVDVARNPLSYVTGTQVAHGKLKIAAATGAYTYTPDAGFTGKDSFSFSATDGVTHLVSNTATVNISVAALPLQAVAPLANDLSLDLYASQTYIGMLSAIDVNGNPMSYVISTKPKNGTATVDAKTGTFTYTPVGGYSGSDSFAYAATDTVSKLASTTAQVQITVVPAPPAPTHHGGPSLTGKGSYGGLILMLLALLSLGRRRLHTGGRRRWMVLAAFTATFLPATVLSDDAPATVVEAPVTDAWYVGGDANLIKPDSKRDATGGGFKGWGLLVGRDLGDFALEFDGEYHADAPKALGDLASWKTYGADGLWYFQEHKSDAFSSFLDGGIGLADQYRGDDSKVRSAYLKFGAGINSAPWRSVPLRFRADLAVEHVFSGYNDLLLSLGLEFTFGGSVPLPAPPAMPQTSRQEQYPMAWCTDKGGQPTEIEGGWVCDLPGGRTESRMPESAPPASTLSSPSAVPTAATLSAPSVVTYPQPPAARH